MADEQFGVIDATKCYTHHALARIFGVADSHGRCSQFVLNNMLKDGLLFRRVGKFYVVSGQMYHLWIQEGSAQWEAWNTKSSGVVDETDSSADGSTKPEAGGKKLSRPPGAETPNA